MSVIKIESILGGIAPMTHFARKDQFRYGIGIDPALPFNDPTGNSGNEGACGLLRPTAFTTIATAFAGAVKWMIQNPKDNNTYLYDTTGSTYTQNGITVTALNDAGAMVNASGNGSDYYDNFIYFAKDTTIARYGPLDGTPTFDSDFWVTTLGKLALNNTSYPAIQTITGSTKDRVLPNHVMHRHADGKLYFADVTNNQGQVHYIRTTKGTVEGDTDNGSTYGALTLGFGFYITAIESYGTNLVLAVFEGGATVNANSRGKAKLIFWDTLSQNFNTILQEEFPDTLITGLKNINGVLYIVSASHTFPSGGGATPGFRVSRYVGGYTIKEIGYFEHGYPCYPGALEGTANRLLIGSSSDFLYNSGCVYSLGLQESALGPGLFNIMQTQQGISVVTALCMSTDSDLLKSHPMVAWSSLVGGKGLDSPSTTYNNALNPQQWQSQMYRVGRPFRISTIRIPFAQAMAANMILKVTIFTDDGSANYTGATFGLPTLNNTVLPNDERYANLKVTGVEGYHNFYIDLKWTGSALLTVNLPIEINFEVIQDQ